MKKGLLVLLVSIVTASGLASVRSSNPLRRTPPKSFLGESDVDRAARRAWWQHDRFGMFIHFGLYALPARHEWVKSREGLSHAEYDDRYRQYFNPDLFDAREWARICRNAGMKYCVLTTKHHEGFCMWDTKTTDFKITNTPFGRDLVKEYVEAFRAEGIRVGFYFSLLDWHHPDFTVDVTHPLFNRHQLWNLSPEERDAKIAELNAGRDMNRFRKYLFDQVEELLGGTYGKVDLIWFDYTPDHPKYGKTWEDWDAVELVKLAHRLQPGILIDSRLDLLDSDDGWDFLCPEQYKVQSRPLNHGKIVPWETCQTFSGSWGYHRDEMSWKSPEQLIELLTETVSKDGNLILNVGPTARGEFDARAKDRLAAIGRWMHWNSRSVYGCGEMLKHPDYEVPNGTSLTYNRERNILYIHLDDYPMGFLPCKFLSHIKYAQFLHDGSELQLCPPRKTHAQDGAPEKNYGGIQVPVVKPEGVIAPVIECFLY